MNKSPKEFFLARFFRGFNNGFGRINSSYTRGVKNSIKATPLVLVMLTCLFVGLFMLFKNKPTAFIPSEDNGRLFVTYEMPEATSTKGVWTCCWRYKTFEGNTGGRRGGWTGWF